MKMTDEEKIRDAAQQHVVKFYDEGATEGSFRSGIEWRDKNPSPEVQALIDALKVEAGFLTLRGMLPVPEHIQKALKPWEKK